MNRYRKRILIPSFILMIMLMLAIIFGGTYLYKVIAVLSYNNNFSEPNTNINSTSMFQTSTINSPLALFSDLYPNLNTPQVLANYALEEYSSPMLTRGAIEYYSMNIGDSDKCMLYTDIVDAAVANKKFSEDSPVEEWLGGYNFLQNYSISPHEINEIFEQVTFDYPILSLYRTGGDSLFCSVSNLGFYSLYTPVTTEYDLDIGPLYQEIEMRAQEIDNYALSVSNGDVKTYINAVYKTLCENTSYSDGIDDTIHANDIYGAMIEGESKCYGLSCAFKYMMDKRGISSFIAGGTTQSGEPHAWNVLYFDGEWFVCDLTLGCKNAKGKIGGVDPSQDYIIQNEYYGCLMNQQDYLTSLNLTMKDECYRLEDLTIEKEQNENIE